MTSRTSILILSLTALAAALSGCGITEWAVAQGSEEADVAQSQSALVSAEAEDADTAAPADRCSALTAEQLAQRAVERAPYRFRPSTCVKASAQGATVTYQLDHCTGRLGYVEVTGTFTLTFAQAADGLHVTGSGSDIAVNRAKIDASAQGACVRANGINTWTVSSAATGTGFRGAVIEHHGDYVVAVDREKRCAELDGHWSTRHGRLERTVEIADLARCQGECPKAGGTVEVKRFNGETLTVTFDGSNMASWSTSDGEAGTHRMRCGA